MKPFSTYREQLKILRERGLGISDDSEAMKILERENYYNVINGYKDLFLMKNPNGSSLTPEQYLPGTLFEEIYELFTLDRELRNLLLKYLLIFENSIKAKISYRFSEEYREPHAYLQMQNYTKDPNQLERVLRLIAAISNQMSKKSKGNNPIKHYLDNHDGVPLWVLVNYLTMGNMSNFYMSLNNRLQDKIAKDFSKHYKDAYGNSLQVTVQSVTDVLKTSNLFRNVCAHEERLYNYSLNKPSKNRHNANLLGIPQRYLKGNLFTVVAYLKLVLTMTEHKQLISNIDKLFNQYQNQFVTVQFSDVLSEMGFPQNWKDYF